MEYLMKEVRFDLYCKRCSHKDLDDKKEPCNECLTIESRENSHIPEYWEGEPQR